jgi:hypothetical protein
VVCIGESEELQAECPTCSAIIPLDAKECPNCGEIFVDDPVEPSSREIAAGEERVELPEGPTVEEEVVTAGRREKILFYLSIMLILLGGPGIALGSWLHDILRIPILGDTYDAFGWMNKLFASAGLLVLIVGIILLILSLRRTTAVVEDYDLSFEGEEEGERTVEE